MLGPPSLAPSLLALAVTFWLAGFSPRNAAAAELSYEAYELPASGERRLIESGTVRYDPERDIKTQRQRDRNGDTFWRRSLPLAGGLSITAHINLEKPVDLTGFGLKVEHQRYPLGFSWEWFNRREDGEYLKLQQGGRVRVLFQEAGPQNEISRIEFQTDITLRFCRSIFECPAGTNTHLVIVKAGSTLDLGSSVAGAIRSTSTTVRAPATSAEI